MAKKLFLLDGMALVYRAHFAFISRPILTSKGVNTSALYGFTQTLLDILKNQQPTHLAVAFDTAGADAAARRVRRLQGDTGRRCPRTSARPCPTSGAWSRRSISRCSSATATRPTTSSARWCGAPEKEGFQSYMVTSDKDFGQLVTREHLHLSSPRGAARAWRSSACRRFRAAGACSAPNRWWMCWR